MPTLVGAAFAAIAQPLEFKTPSDWRIIRSPMLLIPQNRWVDINYVRGLGVSVESVAPDLDVRALRVGSTLVLRIDGERVLRIFDLPDLWDDGGPVQHRFEAWLPESRHYVVRTPCIHFRITYLIAARDGLVTDISVPPIVSPSGRLALLWELNLMDGPHGPELLDLGVSPPQAMAIPPAPNCDPQKLSLRSTARWIDDSQIEFTGFAGTSNRLAEKQFLRIIDGKPQWQC